MSLRRTVNLLPEIFRTDTNKKFLSATLDQLTQEPSIKRTRGYVGRRVGPGVNPADNYVVEPTAVRSDYQLEPGVVFFKPDTNQALDAITYPGIIDSLATAGADVSRDDRLFQSEYYPWDPFCDLDKLTNYSQYYWLPGGPDSVDVGSTVIAFTDDFTVTRNTNSYNFSGVAGQNPVITLVRGGNYRFTVNQPGHEFWIQAAPGVDGRLPATPNISSRDVLGVINNGETQGTVTFNVPLKTAQDFYYGLADIGDVDLITSLKFNQINNVYVDTFLEQFPDGIDGITNLAGRTVVFTNTIIDAQDGGWQVTTRFDPLPRDDANNGQPGSFDTTLFDQTTDITSQAQRYSVWRIDYLFDDSGEPFMQLSSVLSVPELSKFRIVFGAQYSSTNWFKTASGYFEQIPLLTAVENTLWYQDASNPDIFGQIRLVDQAQDAPIDIDEIIGARNYTSPNGVVFTNGLKVQFRGPTVPAQYQDLEYYVEGVGTGPGIDARVGFIDGEAYFGAFHVDQGRRVTGAVKDDSVFQQYIYDTVAESLENPGAGTPQDASLPTVGIAGAIDGNGIKLIPVRSLVTPETYTRSATIPYDSTSYDSTPYDASLNSPLVPDYITINRAGRDRNAWTRSNRWFHIDVIRYTAERNNSIAVIDNAFRGKRPIVEFRANIKLFNSGTQAKTPINVIDFAETDALSNINGQTGYGIDGYSFVQDTLVIFAADRDPEVRNRIYRVDFINPDDNPFSPDIINLVPITNGEALIDQTVVCLSGNTEQGNSFWFDGSVWIRAQQKRGVNQPPLFDVYDDQGRSFSNFAAYPSTNFAGSRLFGYAVTSSGVQDPELGFPLRYLRLDNVGDILFENYLYTDTFDYVQDRIGTTKPISDGFVRQYIDRVTFTSEIGWVTAAQPNVSRQVFRFVSDGSPLIFDVPVNQNSLYPPLQIFVDGLFLDPGQYQVTVLGLNTIVTFNDAIPDGVVIEAQIISEQASSVAYYQVPLNLENNPLNENSDRFTLGTIRTHYESIGQNLRDIQGPIVGANNTRDLGNILRYGDNIVQQSSPLTLSGVFLRQQQFQISNALTYNSQEYSKYKALLLDIVSRGDFVNSTPTQILDAALLEISLGRTENSPFYWSDMIPAGETFIENTYTYSPISTPIFDTVQTYDFTSANFQGLLVYLNGNILTWGTDYVVGDDAPTVTITVPLSVGDVIVIREYATTYGSYLPNTPTKLGLYPSYRPAMYLDQTYVTPTMVIRGHDGSITVAFNDDRDRVLLEFETRIYNNLKVRDNPIPLSITEVLPGQFRDTDYSLAEINTILSQDFLSWVGWNKLDYATQSYNANSAFTYNYSQSSNRVDNQPLLGAWRGIYLYFYDTITPNTTPWQMLGFSERPDWWVSFYGPAPYTSGNLVLWDDLEQGLVRDPAGEYVLPQYRRPGLAQVIPAGSEGQLLNPLEVMVGNYDATSFRRSWTFGDDGPVENVWRSSSAWPFAVMRLLSLTRPAKFFSLFVDRDRYRFDTGLEQYVWEGRYRLDAKNLAPLYGNGVSRASYINWIIDYNQQLGVNSSTRLTNDLSNVGVRLCWRLAGFSDKKYLKIFTERSTPVSTNEGLLLPDESYQILLYANPGFDRAAYSSVIVQATDTGWAVLGYSSAQPFFNVLSSLPNGNTTTITVADTVVRVAIDTSDQVVQVPYGYVFTSRAAVCDFLLSYGRLLSRQGFAFEDRENGYTLDWRQMAEEFLYWSQQGWAVGSMINLNPSARKLSITKPGAVVESLTPPRLDNLILNQNRQALPASNLVIDRLDNEFKITSLTSDTINYANLTFTAYEHLVILDNVSIFADLVYDPITGARQSRIQVSGIISADWNGTVNAPGFVLNQANIPEWQPNRKYSKGEIVLFKDEYWTATTIINPSQMFDYSVWAKSDADQIQTGLLPNAANASDQLATAYSTYNANLEQEVDLFAYGLIGFRPREYMQALNLDDVSQVNLYQQFLGTKGTLRSAQIFSLADLGKESAEYEINEYWAMKLGTYGASANRRYVELLLNQAQLPSDPSLIQIIEPQQESQADQTVLIENIWKSSFPVTSANVLPVLSTVLTDTPLPTAGYVNLEDVDVTVFDLLDPQELNQQLDQIGIGTRIWVARSNAYDWNVYAAQRVAGDIVTVTDNLEGLSLVTFTADHGLLAGDILIIRFFDANINGAYRVVSVTSLNSLLIEYAFTGLQTTVNGIGVGFTLQSIRVDQPASIAQLPDQEIGPGARVWVDQNGQGQWTVLQKTDVFQDLENIEPFSPVATENFGASISQGFFNNTALIGAPGYNPDELATAPGAVYAFIRDDQDQYNQTAILAADVTNIEGFGSDIDIGDQSWAIVGAPDSNSGAGYAALLYRSPSGNDIEKRQVLVASDLDFTAIGFGTSVTMSQDERVVYIGAPGGNKVYAFGRVDVQLQTVTYITDGATFSYNWDDYISINQDTQMSVVYNNQLLTLNVDYAFSGGSITLLFVPEANRELTLQRKFSLLLDQQLYTDVEQDSTSGTGTGALFTVYRVRGVYSTTLTNTGLGYAISDTITIDASTIGGGVSPANDLVLTVTDVDAFGRILAFTPPQITSGVTNTSVFALEPELATATNLWAFTVLVNDTTYRPGIDYDLNSNNELEFITIPPAGATILVEARDYFAPMGVIAPSGLSAGDRFGFDVTTTTDGSQVQIGAPGIDSDTGRCYVYNRSFERFQVVSSTQTQYTTVNTLLTPTTVKLNNSFLINTDLNVDGTFTIDSATQITVVATVSVGDIVQIETNEFDLVQIIDTPDPFESGQFGYAVDQCVNNCSLYVGAPFDGSIRPEAGRVEFWQNQSRVYGTITSTVANPVLSAGDYVSVNGYYVECTGTSIQDLKSDIESASVPNVTVTLTPDLEIIANGTDKVFDVGTIYSAASSYTTRVLLDDVLQTAGVDYTYNNNTEQITFVSTPSIGAVITVVSGRLTFATTNFDAVPAFNKLTLWPATGTIWADLGLDTYVRLQSITSPVPQDFAEFGYSIFISDNTNTLVIGAPNATLIRPTTFDSGDTEFDAGSTVFADPVVQSGAVYIYDQLPAQNASISNPPQFVFGQQIFDNSVISLDRYGESVDLTTGTLLVGAPETGREDDSVRYGRVLQFANPNLDPAWQVLRQQQQVVDTRLLNSIFMYDVASGAAKQYFDFFDPLQGKLLGVVRQNLDFIGAVDPAAYNVGPVNNFGQRWGDAHVGQLWWNTDRVRFIDPNQGDITYASRRWGQVFPNSSVDVYEWIESSVPPAQYTGPGTPLDIDRYVVLPSLNNQGVFTDQYYFWVQGITTVNRAARKTLSAATIARYIENPRGSGISYVAPITPSTLAIYNGLLYIQAQDTVLHVEFDVKPNDNALHVQYQLIPQGRADGFLSDSLYRKLLDSFSGADTFGNSVPDPFLAPANRYGVEFRPRQSLFVNRFLALQNYLQQANLILSRYPITETRSLSLLNSYDPEPSASSGAWDLRVANLEELSYQDLSAVGLGYKYLVVSDSNNNGLWTIYQTASGALPGSLVLNLVRVQNYDTRLYWQRVDWYEPGYDPATRIVTEVPNASALATIDVPVGTSVKVTANGQGLWEIFRKDINGWTRVGLQEGTVQFSPTLWNYELGRYGFDVEVFDSQYFDQAPIIETRKIIEAINQELMIDDLLIERNNLLVLIFNYILSEQQAPEWLTKTSLIDVSHVIRDLVPFQIYRRDNQDFVLDYINEVKPYHTQIRQFNLIYRGLDQYQGTLTDFDVPAYWDPAQNLFISPVLDNTGTLSTTSSTPSSSPIWQTLPWNQWYQNYLLSIESVTVIEGGSGYTVPPEVTVLGESEEPAEMIARINSAGQVSAIVVINPGAGYLTTAQIVLTGGNGSGAMAVAVMGNGLVRQFTTVMKYDRYQYRSNILPWVAGQTYDNGELVRYDDRVWAAASTDSTAVESTTFNPDEWELVAAGTLSGVDRTMGFYAPRVNEPGLDLALLISGVDYPGVQVMGPLFSQNTGFDVGNFDINPFDNISFGPEGRPTYDPAILDAIYASEFTDPYLGTLPAPAYAGDPPNLGPNPIVVDGGAFIDAYSSHAPEELVPGAVFDTLDMRVFTTPGSDWLGDGHGFPSASRRVLFDVADPDINFNILATPPLAISLFDVTSGKRLALGVNYTVDWANYVITVIDGGPVSSGDTLALTAFALGGGNQLLTTESYLGNAIVDNTIIVPVQISRIYQTVIFVNGVQTTAFTATANDAWSTKIILDNTYTATDRVTLTVLGFGATGINYSWSLPITQQLVSDGGLNVSLTNSMGGTNPVNLLVTRNGQRLRPAESVEYISDGSSTVYELPVNGGYDPGSVADNDISVYIDNQSLVLGVGFLVDPWDGSSARTISLADTPLPGSRILVSVRTAAQYWVVGNQLSFRPSAGFVPVIGDIIQITSWNDTAEQNIVTEVFVGPTSQGTQVTEPYDSEPYDLGTVSGDPGSYDYGIGQIIQTNRFDTGRVINNSDRVIVSVNGNFLFEDIGFTVSGSIVEILGPVIATNDVVVIQLFTESVVPGAMAFRIFQDMRGLQGTYRITAETTTTLAQPLSASADTISVVDASRLTEPNLEQGLFGIITIDGERITYRTRDTLTNTLSGLRRGTAGTGVAAHSVGTAVYDLGVANLLYPAYQNRVVFDNFLGDGTQTLFTASSIDLDSLDSTELIEAVEVYVGGIRQLSGYSIIGNSPVSVSFDTAPTAGYQISIRVVQGSTWYQPGAFTPSDGRPLQETNTIPARFLRGF